MKYLKSVITIFLCLIIVINSISQTNIIEDSVKVEQSFKSKLRFSLGFGITNLEQKVTGPATSITSNLNVLNIGFNSTYKASERVFIEAGITSLIGSNFNYYYDNTNTLTKFKSSNSNLQRPINTSFSLVNTSINFNASLFNKKPGYLFFIPNYVFIGPRYDAIIGGGSLKYKNYLGYQYGVKYKLGLKYSNIYPVLTISQTPNIYKSGRPIISDITNRYVSFSLFIESKEGIKKFKKYTPPSKLNLTDIPLFRWLKKS
jgi:hypothetical protein